MLQKAEILSQLEKRMEVLRKMYTAMPPVALPDTGWQIQGWHSGQAPQAHAVKFCAELEPKNREHLH